jgi:hypothetical protein
MEHQDAEITEMVIILSRSCEGRLPAAVDSLKNVGVEIISVDEQEFVVSGTIDSGKIGMIEKLECVNYVRLVQTYIADFAAGDPRNQDGGDGEEAAEED